MSKFIFKYLKKYKVSIIFFIMFLIVSTIASLWIPKILGNYIDSFKNLSMVESKVIYSFIIIAILETISLYLTRYIRNKISNRITLDMIKDLVSRILRLPMDFFNKVEVMYLSNRVNTDSFNLGDFALKFISDGLINVVILIVVFFYIFNIDFKIAFKLMILIPVYFAIYKLLKKTLYIRSMKYKEKINDAMGVMNNQYLNIKTTKINNWYEEYRNTLTNYTDKAQSEFESYCRILFAFDGIDMIVKRLALLILIIYSGFLVIKGIITAGSFTVIIAYFNIALEAFTSIIGFSKAYQEAKVSYERVSELLSYDLEFNGEISLSDINEIKLSNISFSYDDTKCILKNFNYDFERGHVYCVCGKNGVGKSTLLELILGLNNKYGGTIKYNDVNLSEINIYKLRSNIISYVEQEPTLIKANVFKNLVIGLKNYDLNYINEYCKKFKIDEIIKNKNDDNIKLSGGEKQKIAICRALVKNGDLIIMDEPTSALDLKSKEILKEMLLNIKNNKIIILITHDEELKNIADYIIDLNKEIS